MNAIILAGGLGTRLQSILPGIPKIMAPVKGKPFLDHFLEYWINNGITHFYFSLGHLDHIIAAHLRNSPYKKHITLLSEDTQLGTGGAVRHVLSQCPVEIPFLIMNGDTFFEINISDLVNKQSEKSKIVLALKTCEDTSRYGTVVLDESGTVINFNSMDSVSKVIYGGIAVCFDRSIFNIDVTVSSLEKDIFPNLVKERVMTGLVFNSRFIDIGTPESLKEAQTFFGV